MTEQHYFGTVKIERGNNPGRVCALSPKRQARSEARQQREIAVNTRTAIQIRTMIAGLEREVRNLDDSIASELALSGVREPSHFAYPISAKMMQARRENLKTTVAALSERLASIEPRQAAPIPALELDSQHLDRAVVQFDLDQGKAARSVGLGEAGASARYR